MTDHPIQPADVAWRRLPVRSQGATDAKVIVIEIYKRRIIRVDPAAWATPHIPAWLRRTQHSPAGVESRTSLPESAKNPYV